MSRRRHVVGVIVRRGSVVVVREIVAFDEHGRVVERSLVLAPRGSS